MLPSFSPLYIIPLFHTLSFRLSYDSLAETPTLFAYLCLSQNVYKGSQLYTNTDHLTTTHLQDQLLH